MKNQQYPNVVVFINEVQENGTHPMSQMVFDEHDKTLRIDLCGDLKMDQPAGSADHYHIPLNRKQAVKMIGLLEEFVKWNPK